MALATELVEFLTNVIIRPFRDLMDTVQILTNTLKFMITPIKVIQDLVTKMGPLFQPLLPLLQMVAPYIKAALEQLLKMSIVFRKVEEKATFLAEVFSPLLSVMPNATNTFKLMTSIPVLKALEALAAGATRTKAAFIFLEEAVGKSIRVGLQQSIIAALGTWTGQLGQLTAVMTGNWTATKSATEKLEQFAGWLQNLWFVHPLGNAFNFLTQQTNKLMAGLNTIVGAISGFMDALTAVPSAMAPFIQALAPGLMEQFQYSVRILQATIGTALAPAFQILSRIIRDVAGQLAPAMKSLAPVLAAMANAVGAVLLPIVQEISMFVQMFGPFVEKFILGLTPLFTAFRIVMTGVITALKDYFEWLWSGPGDAMGAFTRAMEGAAADIVLFSARLLNLMGAFGAVEGMKAALKALGAIGQKAQGVAPAPEGVGTGGLEDIMRKAAEASITAGGGPAPSDPLVDTSKAILDVLEKFPFDKDTLGKTISDAGVKIWDNICTPVGTFVEGAAEHFWLWLKPQLPWWLGGSASGTAASPSIFSPLWGTPLHPNKRNNI